eukprot:6204914-Pleurochrysis_carterae.AAC.3
MYVCVLQCVYLHVFQHVGCTRARACAVAAHRVLVGNGIGGAADMLDDARHDFEVVHMRVACDDARAARER